MKAEPRYLMFIHCAFKVKIRRLTNPVKNIIIVLGKYWK